MSYKTDFSKIDKRVYYFDEVAADAAVRYIETNIKHVSGPLAGEFLILEDWQKNEIIRPVFGWKHKKTNVRKYTSAYVEIPKKNGKTFLAAAFAAIFLDIDPEKGDVPIFSIAGNNDQARLVFKETKGIISQSRRLSKIAEVQQHSIIVNTKKAQKYFRALASKSETQQGVNPQLVIADEVHIHKDADLIENQRKSMIARKQPFFFMITTAGSDLYGVGYAEHTHAKEVSLGIREDENLLVCIYCSDKEDDPFSEETWKKANPNYGVSVTPEGLQREIKKARHSKSSLNSFLRYHLNQWTQSKDSWINDKDWKRSYWSIKLEELFLLDCYGGLDLSSTSDITAFSLVFRIGKKYISKNWYWLPEDKGSMSADKNNQNYLDWVESGVIEETEGNVVDYDFIIVRLAEIARKFKIKAIAFDPWNSHHIAPKLEDEGHTLIEFRQGFKSMNVPTKEVERLVMSKSFNHQKDPVLRWMAGNAQIQSDPAGNVKIIKDKKQPNKKVDGLISNIMALGLWLDQPEDSGSYMSEEGEMYII